MTLIQIVPPPAPPPPGLPINNGILILFIIAILYGTLMIINNIKSKTE